MRVTPDAGSPWGQRLWFENHEFDAMMDEARQKAGSDVFAEGKSVDVEAILERVYNVVPDYADLPEGILGRTVFHPDGRFDVQISRGLSNVAESDVIARRRLRSTLAHECAHIIEHGHLHLVDNLTPSLFGEAAPKASKVLCRQDSIGVFKSVGMPGYDGKWWEYQANRGMASLLLPKRALTGTIQLLLSARGFRTLNEAMAARQLEDIVRSIMNTFDVSMQLAVYRLQDLGSLPHDIAQIALPLEN